MKLTIRYKKGKIFFSVCLFLVIPLFFYFYNPNALQSRDNRETIVAWSPSSRPISADSHRPSAFITVNYKAELTRSHESGVSGGSGGTTKESPQHSFFSRGWSVENQWWELSGISTLGYQNIDISFWSRGSATGPKNFALEFSIDGDEWFPLTNSNNAPVTYAISNDNRFQQHGPYSLSSVVNDLEQLNIRFLNINTQAVSGDAVKNSGTNYITDIIITAVLA